MNRLISIDLIDHMYGVHVHDSFRNEVLFLQNIKHNVIYPLVSRHALF